MGVLALSLLALVTAYWSPVGGEVPKTESGNFPLDGCSTENMDILFLCFDNIDGRAVYKQKKVIADFGSSILGSNQPVSRVLIADVFDSYSHNISALNVTSFQFYNLPAYLRAAYRDLNGWFSSFSYNSTIETYTNHFDSIFYNITQKIQLIQRLFAEMGDVRKKVTHVAIIFHNGETLSFDETRSISHIVDQQQQVTDIKIFVVVFNVWYVSHVVYMKDTLLLGHGNEGFLRHILLMAVCNQCNEQWFQFRGTEQTNEMSCYSLIDSKVDIDWELASSRCGTNFSHLTTIDTNEELQFLQTTISAYLKDMRYLRFDNNDTSRLTALIYIGLRRDATHISKRFRWSQQLNKITTPLVVNHWLPGKPSGGYDIRCGVWLFAYKNIIDDVSNISCFNSNVVDGWIDVRCMDEISSLFICEATLPRRTEYKDTIRIKPASNESFSQALTKGDFMIFRDNIVSLSANIANKQFLEVLRNSEKGLFPLFDCGEDALDPRYISYVYVCDFIDHCSNRRDEVFCLFKSQETKQYVGDGIYCCDDSLLPIRWVGDGEVDCEVCEYSSGKIVTDESEHIIKSKRPDNKCAFYCDTKCVRFSELNNNITDCISKERGLDETIGKLKATDTCYNSLGHRLWAPKCVYLKDDYGGLIGCRDMSHLVNCTDFECPEGYVKCSNTYCIPQHYVLDGTLDCPSGEEENNYTINSCTANFACWNSKVCLHPDLVCDGNPDCPHQDDEIDCNVTCLDGFRCISGTVTVSDYNIPINKYSVGLFDLRTRYINLPRIEMTYARFYLTTRVVLLYLSHCNLTDNMIYTKFFPNGLQIADLSNNLLHVLDGLLFFDIPLDNIRQLNLSFNKKLVQVKNLNSKLLETLDLSHTSLSLIDKSFVVMFPSMKHLNLSFTQISSIPEIIFLPYIVYQTIDLRGLSIVDFYEDYFNGLRISRDLFIDHFQFCCPQIRGNQIPYHTCQAPDDAISSCFDLIGNSVQRVLLRVIAFLAILCNMTVIVYRLVRDGSVLVTGYGLFVTNLDISDFIMGVYLFIIVGADYYYRDVYVLYDKSWRESVVCKLAGFLATLSGEATIFFVFLITLDRFLVMKFPFCQVIFSKMSKILILLFTWSICFLLALTPIIFKFKIYSSNAVCLDLPLTTKTMLGWKFSFAVYIALNFCLIHLIVLGQRAIFSAMSENTMNQTSSKSVKDITVDKQMLLISLFNFLCWFPVGIMGLMSLGGHTISNDIYSWTTVFILPINSAANPILYTIPVLMSEWERFKHGGNKKMTKKT